MVNNLNNPSEKKEYTNNITCIFCRKKYTTEHKCIGPKEVKENINSIINNNGLNNYTISIDLEDLIDLIGIKSIINNFFDKSKNEEYIYISYIYDLLVFLDSFLENISIKNNINLKDEKYLLIIGQYESQFNSKDNKSKLSILGDILKDLEKNLEGNIKQDLLQHYIFKLFSLRNLLKLQILNVTSIKKGKI